MYEDMCVKMLSMNVLVSAQVCVCCYMCVCVCVLLVSILYGVHVCCYVLFVYVFLCVCRSAFVYLHQPHNHAPLWKDEKQNQVSRWLREQEGKQYELINRPTLSQVFRCSCRRYKSVFQEILSQLKKFDLLQIVFHTTPYFIAKYLASFARGEVA